MGRTRGRPSSLKRRVAVRSPRQTFLIFCEGERTEQEYLQRLKREPDVKDVAAVDLQIRHRADDSLPLKLVKMASQAKKRAADEEGEIDDFWCVFDVEWPANHPYLREALELADREGINVAVSNPCFELWLILHYRDHSGWLDNVDARRLRRSLDGSPDKGLGDADHYMAHRERARGRAEALAKRHDKDGKGCPEDNPSSGMHLLLAAITAGPRG